MQNIRTITLDLDDTLWAIGPVIARAERRLQDWLSANYPRVPECFSRDEIFALKAMGFSGRRIGGLILAETLVFTLPGVALGIGLGVLYNALLMAGLNTLWYEAARLDTILLRITLESVLIGGASSLATKPKRRRHSSSDTTCSAHRISRSSAVSRSCSPRISASMAAPGSERYMKRTRLSAGCTPRRTPQV